MQKSNSRYLAYEVKPSEAFTAQRMNGIFKDMDARLTSVEDKKVSFENSEKQLLDLGLRRINEILGPAAERIQKVSELGFLIASSASQLEVKDGEIVSVHLVKGEQSDMFTPSPFVALTRRSTVNDYAIGQTIYYDRDQARLDVRIVAVYGNAGPHDDWDVSALAGAAMASVNALFETRSIRDSVERDRASIAGVKDNVASDLVKSTAERKAAEVARNKADNLLADFKSRYLGPLVNLPLDVPVGTLAMDIGQKPNIMKQMTETGWAPTVTISIGGSRLQIFIANSDDTTGPFKVDGGFSNGAVFVNGVMLFDGHGVTFDTGEGSFTLDHGVRKGSQIVFQGTLANDVTDIYTKQELDRLLSEHEKRIRIPVGFEGFIEDTLPPDGWLVANGNLHNITAYPDLSKWCGTKWGGDGIKTFAVPDRRGLFLRALDKGRGIDTDRILGSEQEDAIRNITGAYGGSSWGYIDPGSGAIATYYSSRDGGSYTANGGGRHGLTFDASRVVPTAEENRPRNVALLPIIKY